MGYIEDHIKGKLTHLHKADFIGDSVLRNIIWYSPTKEAYAQRDTSFDGTWLMNPDSNDYVKFALKDSLSLKSLRIFETAESCNEAIDSLNNEYIMSGILFCYVKRGTSLFSAFIDGLRNGFAHGTFNAEEGRFFLISQHRPNPESPIKFAFQTYKEIANALIKAKNWFYALKEENNTEAKYSCLTRALQIQLINDEYYSAINSCRIIIEDGFSYTSDKHSRDIKSLANRYSDQDTIIIIKEKLHGFAERNTISDNGKAKVIAENRIIEFFGLND